MRATRSGTCRNSTKKRARLVDPVEYSRSVSTLLCLPRLRAAIPMSKHTRTEIPEDLRPYLDAIADRLLSGHAAVMVGAGFSRNAAPPRRRQRVSKLV